MLIIVILALASCTDAVELGPPLVSPEPQSTQPPAGPTVPPPPSEPQATIVVTGDGLPTGTGALYERAGELWWFDAAANAGRAVLRGLPQRSLFEPARDPWALAPDGRSLALAQNGPDDRATLLLLSSAGIALRDAGGYDGRIEGLAWSHDSQRLAFLVNRRDQDTAGLLAQSLYLYDTVLGSAAVMYRDEFRAGEAPQLALWLEGWVPGDGALYVAFALEGTNDPGTLYALDARGGEPQVVTPDYLLKGGEAVCTLTSEVLLRQRPPGQGGAPRASPVYVGRAGRDGALAGFSLLSPEDWTVGSVAWAPDGQRVVVERLELQAHGTYTAHLWLLGLDGAEPRQLTADEAYREERPTWLPGGAGILFQRWRADRPEPAGLWFMDLEGEPVLVDEAGAWPQTAAQVSP